MDATQTISTTPAVDTSGSNAAKDKDGSSKHAVADTPSNGSATNGGAAEGKALENETTDTTDKDPSTVEEKTDDEPQNDKEWNFAHRKVVIQNIFKYFNAKRLQTDIDEWIEALEKVGTKIVVDRVKKPPKEPWMVLTLSEEAMVQPFVDYINKSKILNKKGVRLVAKPSDNEEDNKKRKRDDRDSDDRNKRPNRELRDYARRPVTEDEVKNAITPLWREPYSEQLETKKKEMIKKCTMKVVQEIKTRVRKLEKEKSRDKVGLYSWLAQNRSIELEDILPSPNMLRNKCEFTFGYRYSESKVDGDEPTRVPAVGFMATGWAGGVSQPHCCENIPPEALAVVDTVNDFLTTSQLPPYDSKVHKGFWRFLVVRTSKRTNECMVIIVHSPTTGGKGESAEFTLHFEKEKKQIVNKLLEAKLSKEAESPMKVTSLFFQEFEGLSNPGPDHPVQHIHGNEYLTERLRQCNFQISPGAFFQVNTEGAELLYGLVVDKVREVCPEPAKVLLFDVCCGTGTIGLTCMKEKVVGKVIGIDISAPAINDAKQNAVLNNFTVDGDNPDAHFVASRAEEVLAREIRDAKSNSSDYQFVAVVDPAREGLHTDVIKTLRSNGQISRLVYVSCNPTTTLVRDAALLCAPPTKRYGGRPFKVTAAVAVDMFPYTKHCEMVMTFDRMSKDEC